MQAFNLNKKVLLFASLMMIFCGCDKVEQTKKKFSGNWQVYSYRLIDNNGFTHEYPASGSFYLESCNEETCSYSLNLSYTVSGTPYNKTESGKYKLKDTEYYELYRNTSGIIDTLEYGRILLLTKKDLKTEFKDSSGMHVLVLEK